jgi:hypothetical protein
VKIVRWLVGSWLSRIYLITAAAVIVWAMVTYAKWGQPYADVAITCTMLLTGPGSWPLLAAAGRWNGNTGVFLGCVVAGALINAVALNAVAAVLRQARVEVGERLL